MFGIAKPSISGAEKFFKATKSTLNQTIKELNGETEVSFPETTYNLPLIYGLFGKRVRKLNDLKSVLETAENLVTKEETMGGALNAGLATLIAAEVIEATKYAKTKTPYKAPYSGFIPDAILRGLGVDLVNKVIPAIAVVVGKTGKDSIAGDLGKDLGSKNILSLLVGPVTNQMQRSGIKFGLTHRMVPLGPDFSSIIHGINLAVRIPLMFGGVTAGKRKEIVNYIRERLPVFVVALGPLDALTMAVVTGVMAIGIPVITDQRITEVSESLISQTDLTKIVDTACRVRGIETRELRVEIPVGYGPIYEGESVRKEQMWVEFGSGRSMAFEIVRMRNLNEVEDGRVVLNGLDVSDMEEGDAYPLGIIVEVAGKSMEKDFEPVLERRIHQFVNRIEGVMHLASRDVVWIRISKDAVKRGFRLGHVGNVLCTMYHSTFPTIAEKVQVTILTSPQDVKKSIEEARRLYAERDKRLSGLTEEGVYSFYGCVLCQSFAPDHVCVITPERPSLCGATSWFDARASHKLDPQGPSFLVEKGGCIDPIKGEWGGVNKIVYEKSHQTVQRVFLHSMFECPLTSCGCFEAIVFYIPEVDGFGVVDRGFRDSTVNGLPFSTMAGFAGGGKQTEGFLGVSVGYIKSNKFLKADSGLRRVVWLPKKLKETIREAIQKNLYDKIATEQDVRTISELRAFLERVGHPVIERWQNP